MSTPITYRRSYFYSWEYGLLVFLGAAFLAAPGAFTDAWLAYASLTTEPESVDRIFRILGLALVAVAAGCICRARIIDRYQMQADGVEARCGLIGAQVNSLRFRHMRGIVVSKTLMGMLLGYGTVRFTSDRAGENDVVFTGIDEPEALREIVRKIMSGEEVSPERGASSTSQDDPVSGQGAAPHTTAEEPTPSPAAVLSEPPPPPVFERTEPVITEPEHHSSPKGVLLSEATDDEIYGELARRAERNSQRINFETDTHA